MNKKAIIVLVALLALVSVVIVGVKSGFTIRQVVRDTSALERTLPEPSVTPLYDPNRLNVLLLGIRGIHDPNGGLLSDAVILASVRKSDGRVALVSFPRDIYLGMPNGAKARFNAAYALGEEWQWGGGGLVWAKRALEDIAGVSVDHVFSVDFAAFEKIIDILGGVPLTLEEPFSEPTQWTGHPGFASSSGAFFLPAGRHLLDGETALFYVRSRYSTSDFDRARRIQRVLLAVRARATSLGFLANPVKVIALLDVLRQHLRTDASLRDAEALIALASRIDFGRISQTVLDTSPDGLLREEHIEGAYVLLAQDGTFEAIREKVRNIFNDESLNPNL